MTITDRATLVLSAALFCAPLVACGPSSGGGASTGGTTGGGTSGGSSANVNTGHGSTGGPTATTGGSGGIALPTVRADGAIVIGPGFTPTPIIMGGSAGGTVDASTMAAAGGTMAYGYSCIGMMPATPQHVLEVTGPIAHLRIVVDTFTAGVGGSNDTTLMVRMPDGSYWCDDDGGGELQPMVEGMVSMPGRVEVFVGGYSSSGVGARYKIAFTESYDYTHYSIRGTAPPAYSY